MRRRLYCIVLFLMPNCPMRPCAREFVVNSMQGLKFRTGTLTIRLRSACERLRAVGTAPQLALARIARQRLESTLEIAAGFRAAVRHDQRNLPRLLRRRFR